MAPEVLKRSKYSEKADVFSFGVLLTELFTGRAPFEDMDVHPLHLAQEICEGLRPSTHGLTGELEQIVRDCWVPQSNLRPDMGEIENRLRRLRGQVEEEDVAGDDEFEGASATDTPLEDISEDLVSVVDLESTCAADVPPRSIDPSSPDEELQEFASGRDNGVHSSVADDADDGAR